MNGKQTKIKAHCMSYGIFVKQDFVLSHLHFLWILYFPTQMFTFYLILHLLPAFLEWCWESNQGLNVYLANKSAGSSTPEHLEILEHQILKTVLGLVWFGLVLETDSHVAPTGLQFWSSSQFARDCDYSLSLVHQQEAVSFILTTVVRTHSMTAISLTIQSAVQY